MQHKVIQPPLSSNSSHLQAIPVRKFPRSRKPPAIKTAVILKRANGEDKTKIANDLGITRNTVRAILEESDIDRHLESGQIQIVQLIPEAIRVAKHRLAQNSENMAIKLLENTVLPIQGKAGKAGDPALVLAIQTLMGNVTVHTQEHTIESTQDKPIDVAAVGAEVQGK